MNEFTAPLHASSNRLRAPRVLFVDLDGTLIRTDIGIESALQLLRTNIAKFLQIPIWLLKGKSFAKRRISDLVEIQAELLPYNTEVLELLNSKKDLGAKLVLATASDLKLVKPVYDYLGIFDDLLATDQGVNLSGRNKLMAMRERFGAEELGYAGNAPVDRAVWSGVDYRIVVSPNRSFSKEIVSEFENCDRIDLKQPSLKDWCAVLRVHQWIKNLLIFLPLLLAHQLDDMTLWSSAFIAFIMFSAAASSVYILNDLVDLEADRSHPTKSSRPFAAGVLTPQVGLILLPFLFLIPLIVSALLLPTKFILCLGAYYVLTTSYSCYFKRLALVDIIILASLYTMRIIAGGAAVDVHVSKWLLAFSMFIFLSLACVKRYSELLLNRSLKRESVVGRGYQTGDLDLIANLGSSSGYLAVLVFALYISSSDVAGLYLHPDRLWILCPIMLFWVSRIWLLAHRGQLHLDPIVFALNDRLSYFLGLIAVVIVLFAGF